MFWACFIKILKENLRDWKILCIVLVFSPFFVYLMFFYMNNPDASNCRVLVWNQDSNSSFSQDLLTAWKQAKDDQGKPILQIIEVQNPADAQKQIKNRTADLFITIPNDFSESYSLWKQNKISVLSPIKSYYDCANPKYMIAASLCDYSTYSYIGEKTGKMVPLSIQFESAHTGGFQHEFDLYVPALLVLSMIMILFTAGASVIREIEKNTILRLKLSLLNFRTYFAALTLNQIVLGIGCLMLTLAAAYSVGYHTKGNLLLLCFIGCAVIVSVVAVGIITAAFIPNMFGLLTLGCFPFFIMMFFSDCFIPLPKIKIGQLLNNPIFLNDFLPTAAATKAITKILNFQAGLKDIGFDLLWIVCLSIIYFTFAAILFHCKHNQKR